MRLKVQIFSCENEFYLHETEFFFFFFFLTSMVSFALHLALKQRLGVTRKWPIRCQGCDLSEIIQLVLR